MIRVFYIVNSLNCATAFLKIYEICMENCQDSELNPSRNDSIVNSRNFNVLCGVPLMGNVFIINQQLDMPFHFLKFKKYACKVCNRNIELFCIK